MLGSDNETDSTDSDNETDLTDSGKEIDIRDLLFDKQSLVNNILNDELTEIIELLSQDLYKVQVVEGVLIEILLTSNDADLAIKIKSIIENAKNFIKIDLYKYAFSQGENKDWRLANILMSKGILNPVDSYNIYTVNFVKQRIEEKKENFSDQEYNEAKEMLKKLEDYLNYFKQNLAVKTSSDNKGLNQTVSARSSISSETAIDLNIYYLEKIEKLEELNARLKEDYNSNVPSFLKVTNEKLTTAFRKRKLQEGSSNEDDNRNNKKPRTR